MKKLITLILILFVTLPAQYASGEADHGFSQYSDEQIFTLNQIIQNELFTRGAAKKGVLVPTGEYMIGTDIPEGVYNIQFADDSYDGFLEVFEGGTDFTCIVDRIEIGAFAGITEIGRIDLNGKSMIKIDLPGVFTTYTGLFK